MSARLSNRVFSPRTRTRKSPLLPAFVLSLPVLLTVLVFATPEPASSQALPKFKVLVVGLPDPNHPTTGAAGNKAVQDVSAGQNYTVDICLDHSKLTDAYLASYQVMVWTMAAPLNWPRSEQAAIEKFIQSGKGWIGFHVAGLTGISNPEWTWYQDWLGGLAFKGHPATRQNGTVKVEAAAATHAALAGIPASFSIHEEWYSWNKSPRGRPDIAILATVDETSYAPGGSNMPGDHPIMWSNTKYGPMIYTALGHEPEAYGNANVRKFLANAIPWAAGAATTGVTFVLPERKDKGMRALLWDGSRLRVDDALYGHGADRWRDVMGRGFGAGVDFGAALPGRPARPDR